MTCFSKGVCVCDVMREVLLSVQTVPSLGVYLGCCTLPWMKELSPRQQH